MSTATPSPALESGRPTAAAAGPVIDGLVFVGKSLLTRSVDRDTLDAELAAADVAGAVIAPLRPPGYSLPPANDEVLAWADADPRLIPLCRVDPWQRAAAVTEVRRAHGLGARGVLIHPWEESVDIGGDVALAVTRVAAELGLTLVVPGGFPWRSEALQVAELAVRAPELTVVMTNGGQLNMSGLAGVDVDAALRVAPNLVVQSSGLYRQDFLDAAVSRFGADRVAFGSSSPYFDLRLEAARARRIACTSVEDHDLVLSGNTRRWFGVGG
jgi:predicted TIM-barrel fold metal-dependent hydrolase